MIRKILVVFFYYYKCLAEVKEGDKSLLIISNRLFLNFSKSALHFTNVNGLKKKYPQNFACKKIKMDGISFCILNASMKCLY